MLATHERACDCCDIAAYHFDTLAQLRRFLASDHPTHVNIDVADVPGEPYGMVFVTAGEAEAWLAEHDERVARELAAEGALERYGRSL
jgi:acyl transferase domain-containing protein